MQDKRQELNSTSFLPGENTVTSHQFDDYPDVMNICEMCSLLDISTKTGYRLLRNGTIFAVKVGRSYRIAKDNILSYLGAKQNTDL